MRDGILVFFVTTANCSDGIILQMKQYFIITWIRIFQDYHLFQFFFFSHDNPMILNETQILCGVFWFSASENFKTKTKYVYNFEITITISRRKLGIKICSALKLKTKKENNEYQIFLQPKQSIIIWLWCLITILIGRFLFFFLKVEMLWNKFWKISSFFLVVINICDFL